MFPPTVHKGSSLYARQCLFSVFMISHFIGCQVSHCEVDLHFPICDAEHLSCGYWPFIHLLWRNVYPSPLPIFRLVVWFCCGCFTLFAVKYYSSVQFDHCLSTRLDSWAVSICFVYYLKCFFDRSGTCFCGALGVHCPWVYS